MMLDLDPSTGRIVGVILSPPGDMFILSLIDAVELIQQADRLYPDSPANRQIHLALYALTTAIAMTAADVAVEESEQ